MESITFECETITPMFLAGAYPKNPELRPPTIKAAMRFWWRAINADKSISDLRREESEIFGGSGETEGRSKFNIKCKTFEKDKVVKSNLKDLIWDKEERKIKDTYEGMGYLLYSTYMGKSKSYFDSLKFEVEITSNKKEVLEKMAKLFHLLSLLGSLGTRARRGAGNFRILKSNKGQSYIPAAEIKEDLRDYIKTFIDSFCIRPSAANCSYSNLLNAKIFIMDGKISALECLEVLGKNYKSFRSSFDHYKNPDYQRVKDYLQTGAAVPTIEKAAMGLPLSYKYRSLNGQSALIEGANKDHQRSSSPILFKVIHARNGNSDIYFPAVLIFNRYLLPVGNDVKIKETNNRRGQSPQFVSQPSNTIIDDFIAQLPLNVEVVL